MNRVRPGRIEDTGDAGSTLREVTQKVHRLVLLAFALTTAPTLAETVVENGYEITRSQTVQQAPHGWVGRKTTDRETRVGNTEETDGNSVNFVMTIGGWAKRCPTAEGVVDGTFEYVITKDDVISDEVETRRSHYNHRLLAELKGQVGDDAQLQYVEIQGEFTRQQDGTPTERRTLPPTRFTPGRAGEPDYEAMRRTVEVTADLSFATAMLMAGVYYMAAEVEWVKLNACVEFSFDPPTDTRSLGANQSADVRADIQTKGEQKALVSRWGRFNANAIDGIGNVTPREGEAPSDSPHTIRYTASAQPKRGHGFDIAALTRAGVAEAKWRIIDPGFEGTFRQTETTSISGTNSMFPGAGTYGIGMTGRYKITGRLVWTPTPEPSRASSFGSVASTFYLPTDGEITVEAESTGMSLAGSCTIEGSKTFAIRSLPPGALKYLELEVAANERYRLMLGMISNFLQFQATQNCSVRAAPGFPIALPGGGRQAVVVNDAAIVIGRQEGRLTENNVVGQTATPIVIGPHTYTGEWEFKRIRQ